MAAIHAFIKKDHLDKYGEAPLIFEYAHLGARWRINTGIKVNPENIKCVFDQDLEQYKLSAINKLRPTEKEKLKNGNGMLMDLTVRLNKVIAELKSRALSLTPSNVEAEYNRAPETKQINNEKPVLVWYQEFIAEKETEIGGGINSYRSTFEHFKVFIAKRGAIRFEDINRAFLSEFRNYFLPFKFSGPSIHKQFKNLRIFLNWVADKDEDGEIRIPTAYKKMSLKARYADPIGLKLEQFLELYNMDLSFSKELDRTRDLFIFGVSIGGPRHGDLHRLGSALRRNGFKVDQNAISYFESKTGNAHQEILMNQFGANILKKYNYTFPYVPCNFRMNANLKSIANKLDWNEVKFIPEYDDFGKLIQVKEVPLKAIFSSKFMRKTAASIDNMLGIPIKTSMKRTGHKTFAAFSRYVDVDRESLRDANKQWDELLTKASKQLPEGVIVVEMHELRFAA